jgi:hypothetical protein
MSSPASGFRRREKMKNRIISIPLAVALILSVGLIGCTTEYGPEIPEYNLAISTTEGGSVTSPGEGIFAYDEGTDVNLEAVADEGYLFDRWVGDVGTIADFEDATTTITMNGDYIITANFKPIDVSGYWKVWHTQEGQAKEGPDYMTFTQAGNDITIADSCYSDDSPTSGTINGTSISFSWTKDGVTITATGTVSGNTMSGQFSNTDAESGTWRAEKISEPDCPTTQRATINIDGNPDDWSSLEPALVDPQGDSICGADADIKRIYTAMDDSYAYVMVETYGVPINPSAIIEMNFDYKAGRHFTHGSRDDLHTGASSSGFGAVNDNDLDGTLEPYPIIGYVIARGDVMELAIPLSQIENARYFNPTFVNIWDDNYQLNSHGCDPSTILPW